MSPDDQRHGTTAGHAAGCREDCCDLAKLRYDKRRKADVYAGKPRTVPAVGTMRRLHALQALGYSLPRIAEAAGCSERTLQHPIYRGSRVYATTAQIVADVYDKLSMVTPVGPYVKRSQIAARRKGWPPPLAWDDDRLDDPTHTPRDWQYREPTRREYLTDLVADGGTVTEACWQLRISQDSLERWADRNGCRDLYMALVRRERSAA